MPSRPSFPLFGEDDPENLARLVTDWENRIPLSMAGFISSQVKCRGVRAAAGLIQRISTGKSSPNPKLAAALEYWTGIHRNTWTFGPRAELRKMLVARYPPLSDWEFDPPTTPPVDWIDGK